MRSRFSSSNSGPVPDVATPDPGADSEEDSTLDSSLPNPSLVLPQKDKYHQPDTGIDPMSSSSLVGKVPFECLPVQRIYFGSFYLRMGAVGNLLLFNSIPHLFSVIFFYCVEVIIDEFASSI